MPSSLHLCRQDPDFSGPAASRRMNWFVAVEGLSVDPHFGAFRETDIDPKRTQKNDR